MAATARPATRRCHFRDDRPGIRRERVSGVFRYVDARGRRVTDADALARIRALAIPPAWEGVWICPKATDRDEAGGAWRLTRQTSKDR